MSKIVLLKNFDTIGDNQQKLIGKYNSEINYCQDENIYNIKRLLIEKRIKKFDICFLGEQLQSKLTIELLKERLKDVEFNITKKTNKLDDIDYGEYSFKSKLDIINEDCGEYLLYKLLNDFNYSFKNGESLKSKFKEIYKFYEKTIKKIVKEKLNILIITSDLNIKFLKMILKNYNFEEINLETFISNENECLFIS
jgi:bisphosphoglycerate-dependent phosphoglycerate mutase